MAGVANVNLKPGSLGGPKGLLDLLALVTLAGRVDNGNATAWTMSTLDLAGRPDRRPGCKYESLRIEYSTCSSDRRAATARSR